jgi:hypothetical protein
MGGGPPWRSWLPDIFGANFSENIFFGKYCFPNTKKTAAKSTMMKD